MFIYEITLTNGMVVVSEPTDMNVEFIEGVIQYSHPRTGLAFGKQVFILEQIERIDLIEGGYQYDNIQYN